MADVHDLMAAITRVVDALEANRDHLTELDQAVGDGDLGITASNMATALREAVAAAAAEQDAGPGNELDLGKLVAQTGMAVNRAASSSFGTLMATALMRAGKAVRGKAGLEPDDLVSMLEAADLGIQERGKAKPGDKTVIDVVHPAATALRGALAQGSSLAEARARMLEAAQQGLDAVTPLRSKIGRAGWVGERTEGKVDPGAAAGLLILQAIAGGSD